MKPLMYIPLSNGIALYCTVFPTFACFKCKSFFLSLVSNVINLDAPLGRL